MLLLIIEIQTLLSYKWKQNDDCTAKWKEVKSPVEQTVPKKSMQNVPQKQSGETDRSYHTHVAEEYVQDHPRIHTERERRGIRAHHTSSINFTHT